MRILIVTYEYPPVGGGAATAAEAIAKELVQLGHDPVILTGHGKGLPKHEVKNGISIRRVPSVRRAIDHAGILEMATFLAAGLLYAPRLIRKHRIEAAVVFFSLPCGPIGLFSRWVCGTPYIVALRGGDVPGAEPSLRWLHRLLAPFRRSVLRHSLAITANSEGLRRMAEAADPFPVQVIANGVDTAFFRPPAGQFLSPRPARPLRVLFVGRFQGQKNLNFFLEEIAQLPQGAITVDLVGDGPDRTRLRDRAQDLGLAEFIQWHGWVPRSQLLSFYQAADCLVNPSLYEGMSNVMLEAMACGLPVIASNVAGNASLVVDGQTGLLFHLESGSLARALERLIGNPDLRAELGAESRARVLSAFSWRRAAVRYVQLLEA